MKGADKEMSFGEECSWAFFYLFKFKILQLSSEDANNEAGGDMYPWLLFPITGNVYSTSIAVIFFFPPFWL